MNASTANPTSSDATVEHGAVPGARPPSQTIRFNRAIIELAEHAAATPPEDAVLPETSRPSRQNALVQVRLGIASALFIALRCKSKATAAHSLRVALGCSAWARTIKMPDGQRDELEVAGLLHDIGKVGVADAILSKPGRLSPEEAALMNNHWGLGLQILDSFSPSQSLREVIRHAAAWYDGTKPGYTLRAEGLPLGSRMLAIVDAFDAMTTDHVYRQAMPRQRAAAELFLFAGKQFDPQLVRQFSELDLVDQQSWQASAASDWLRDLDATSSSRRWRRLRPPSDHAPTNIEEDFQRTVVEEVSDAIIWTDTNRQITHWNDAASRMTGIPASGVLQKFWQPSLLDLCDANGRTVSDEDCPVLGALKSRAPITRRYQFWARRSRQITVEGQFLPVIGEDRTLHGVAVVLHDVSGEESLERRLEKLHEKVTLDPLTQIANRAEFERAHERFVESHLTEGKPYSLVICDLDHFKSINDTYGHQAGDQAIQSFAALLKRLMRAGDLVARYGGEEFVVLCCNCNLATAAERAEQLRRELALILQPMLMGRTITASFGVTEVQPGDSPDSMLRRADRALLRAKELGRNMVIQAGIGALEIREEPKDERASRKTVWNWFRKELGELKSESKLSMTVPLEIAVQKLRGFVADHHATLDRVEGRAITLSIDQFRARGLSGSSQSCSPLTVEMLFQEENEGGEDAVGGSLVKSAVMVEIKPKGRWPLEREDFEQQSRKVLASLRAYLMATQDTYPTDVIP